jgi:putative transposase
MILCFSLKILEEELEQKYDLKARGYDFDRAAQRVAKVMAMKIEQVTTFGKSPPTVKARSLLCFWAHRKLGMTTIEIGKRLNISQSAVRRSSLRGQKIERENRFELIELNA